MTDKYIQQLTAITTASGNFVIPICDDPSGTSELRKITFANLTASISNSGAVWGNITGTLSNQSDLQSALNAKASIASLGQAAFYNSGQIFFNTPHSGTPTAPTAANGTNTTQLATTAFVTTAITNASGGVTSVAGRTGAITLVEADVTGLVSDLAAKANINNPALNGTIIFSGIIQNSILKVNSSNVLTSGVIGVDYVVPAITTVYSGQHYLTPVNLTSGSTVNWNMDTAPNAILRVPSGVFTMANPTNIRAGAGGMLTIVQPAVQSASGVISWGSAYKFAGGTKFVLSGPANSRDQISWYSSDGTTVDMVGSNAFS